MAAVLDLQPSVMDLILYSGDGFTVTLKCTNSSGAPVDLTGTVAAQIRLDRLTAGSPIVQFAVNLTDAYLGIVRLSLTGLQTKALTSHASAVGGVFHGVWDVEWDSASAEPRTLIQGDVECVIDVTH